MNIGTEFFILGHMSTKKYAVIVAGGSGSRMGANQPKQFLLLEDLPILMHTILAFNGYEEGLDIILVLPSDHFSTWKDLCQTHSFDIPHKVVAGGESRFASCRNGLDAISGDGLVAIHDGARPLVTAEVIDASYQAAAQYGNGIVAVSLKDTLRKVTHEVNATVNREHYFAIQTPQTFQVDLIKKAFDQADPNKVYTDDASVLEDLGEEIHLAQGSYENIKVTTPEDLVIASAILKSRQ